MNFVKTYVRADISIPSGEERWRVQTTLVVEGDYAHAVCAHQFPTSFERPDNVYINGELHGHSVETAEIALHKPLHNQRPRWATDEDWANICQLIGQAQVVLGV